MCGIAGFAGQGGKAELKAMADAMAHRGPDGEGFYADEESRVFLAHRRLAIIDIAGGFQPMWNGEGSIGVVFNGEIYNHNALRAQLRARGHQFVSDHSDTEVLIHGYREWGESLPEKLHGMFAFVIYDRVNKCLFMARDRFGKKPFYYTQRGGFFAFASELTALARHPSVQKRVSPLAVKKYFAYGYIPAPGTLYDDIAKLPGGYAMRYDLDSQELRRVQYWAFAAEPDDALLARPLSALADELRNLMQQAVRKRLMSDVPLGFFLSGGIDSSIVVAEAAKIVPPTSLHTYSIGFAEASFDETPYALKVAEKFSSMHHSKLFDIDSAQQLAARVLGHMDEPLGDASLLPTAALCAFARSEVTVALGGDGGDELFAGYDPFRALTPAQWYYRLMPKMAKRAVRLMADAMPASERNISLDFKIKRTLRGLDYPAHAWLPVWMSPLEPYQIAELLMEPVSYETLYEDAIDAWERSRAKTVADKASEFFVRFYLQDDILTKVDRASMMASLEVRAPFLDFDVVEFVRRLPHTLKYRNGQSKFLLKYAYRDVLPEGIADRKKKGFGIPLTAWMKQWPLEAHRGRFHHDASWVRGIKDVHDSGKADERLFLWSWTALQRNLD